MIAIISSTILSKASLSKTVIKGLMGGGGDDYARRDFKTYRGSQRKGCESLVKSSCLFVLG